DGTIRWERTVGDPNLVEEGRDIQATREGGFVITGYNGQVLTSFNDLILLKTSAEGTAMTNYIRGRVIQDADGQCDADEAEAGLAGWLVKAVSESGLTYYGTSDANGHYSIRVDAGSYQVSVEPANAYWQVCEPNGVSLRLDAVYDTTTVNFPVTTGIVCPYLEIDVSTPFLASCNEINYLVSYSNLGTETANNAYVEVQLDAELGFQQASLPATDLGNGRYRIALGNIAPGTGSVFQLNTTLPCDGIAEQQAIQVSARIFPDSSCLQPSAQWDGSSIRVSANCVQQDTVEFTIQNIGQQRMLMPRRSIVIVDDVVLRYLDRSYQLGTQEETRVRIPSNGATFRLVAEQAAGHPGRSTPTVAVEGCVENGQAFTTGYVTQFPENDQDPFISIDVQEAGTAPASPVFLRGYPKGYRDSIVSAQTDLTYTILFANTGEDTVRRVVIRDTLSSALDLAQLEPGAASHPYRLEVYDQGYIRITFDDINLVPAAGDGNPKNYAFVEFRISQKPDNPAGTVIDNRAMVFFDYEVPALTNQTRHRVDVFPDFVEVVTSTKEIFVPGVNVQIYPNPFSESVRFQVEGGNFQLLRLSVYDLNGRLVSQQQSPNGQELMFFRGTLPTGSYIYRLESGRQLINSGKIIVR
ncbi:MAG: T9SS type A sorting domain-containing protein, partial [Lewinellaceae bacterium]|nr:T9SS type A sorting domain-containing protein [Lewinellaceae bacterium]